jgi:hypothetical protein
VIHAGLVAAERRGGTIGLDEEGVRRVLQQELARIAEKKGVPVAPLRAVLENLGAGQSRKSPNGSPPPPTNC